MGNSIIRGWQPNTGLRSVSTRCDEFLWAGEGRINPLLPGASLHRGEEDMVVSSCCHGCHTEHCLSETRWSDRIDGGVKRKGSLPFWDSGKLKRMKIRIKDACWRRKKASLWGERNEAAMPGKSNVMLRLACVGVLYASETLRLHSHKHTRTQFLRSFAAALHLYTYRHFVSLRKKCHRRYRLISASGTKACPTKPVCLLCFFGRNTYEVLYLMITSLYAPVNTGK